MNFKDQVVVVTGAGGVLCSYFCEEYAKAGAKVALLDLNEERVLEVAAKINQAGGTAKGYKTNVLDKENIEAVHQQILVDLGPCDILVNGAGGNNPKAQTDIEYHQETIQEDVRSFFDLDASGIEFVFNLNFLGTLLPTQVFAADMVAGKAGNILNVSSMNAFTPLTKIPAYSGAKAAISNFTQWLAVYFSKMGIRCNAIAPGFLVSNQNRDLLFSKTGEPTARAEKILRNTPLERFGEPEELIGGLFFLTDNQKASFITGVVLPIDGGFSAYSGV